MRRTWLLAPIVSLLSLVCALAAFGQNPTVAGQYVISAKAGGVNYVSGKVTVMRKSGTSGLVVEGDEIQIGDKVTTGEDGRIEVLLNPGSYLRMGAQSSFEFTSTDLENLRVNLRAGSAIFEVYATNEFKVSVRLPQSQIVLNSSGVFRVDVLADGSGRVAVFKGETNIGPGRQKLGSGRVATVTKTGVSIAKFDRDTKDPLDIWSKARAKELTSANAKLQRDSLRNSLLSSFGQRGWNLYNSFGVWVFDPSRRAWLFLPFGYGWSSPYGWDYSYDLWRCRMPVYVWNPPVYQPPVGGGGGGGGRTPQNAQIIEDRRQRMHAPPFQRLEQQAISSGASVAPTNDASIYRTNDRGEVRVSPRNDNPMPKMESPVYSPPMSAPASMPTKVEAPVSMPTKGESPIIRPNQ
jgi:hypothetical protein